MTTAAEAKAPRTDTRKRILEVSAALFAQHGYAGTSIRDISEELGVTKAALYYHFPSKEDILGELIAEPVAAVRSVMEQPRELTRPEERKQFVIDVILAMSSCDRDVVAVFKDPTVAPLINQSVVHSGVTSQVAMRLAMGLSGVDDPEQVRPSDLIRAIAAVGAGYEAINSWHLVYPDCDKFADANIDVIMSYVCAVLEAEDPGAVEPSR